MRDENGKLLETFYGDRKELLEYWKTFVRYVVDYYYYFHENVFLPDTKKNVEYFH